MARWRTAGAIVSALVVIFTLPATADDYPKSLKWWKGQVAGIDGDTLKNVLFFVAVGAFLIFVFGPPLLRAVRNRRAKHSPPDVVPLPAAGDSSDEYLPVLASSGPNGELLLELLREEWHNRGHLAHILEAQLRITNRSSSTKRISGWGVGMQFALKFQHPVSAAEVERFAETLRQTRPQIRHQHEVPPGGQVEGWWVVAMDFGPPEYQMIVHDELENAYRIHRPAMERKAYGSDS